MDHLEPSRRTSPGAVDDAEIKLPTGLVEAARALLSAGGADDTLQAVVDLAVQRIDGCDHAGIFVIEGDTVSTRVHTDPVVVRIDAIQHRTGEGPGLDAIDRGAASTPRT